MRSPCLGCGACCAYYRVSFHWSETDRALGGVTPAELTVKVSPQLVAMRGTDLPSKRCAALAGEIGRATRCSIYAERPSPCRELEPSWAKGVPNVYSINGFLYYELPNGELSREDPYQADKK